MEAIRDTEAGWGLIPFQERWVWYSMPQIDARRESVIRHNKAGLTVSEQDSWVSDFNALDDADRPGEFGNRTAPRKGSGPSVTFDRDEFLGTVQTLDSFLTYVARPLSKAVGLDPTVFERDLTADIGSSGSGSLSTPLIAMLFDSARTGPRAISAEPTWCWRNESRGGDALSGLNPSQMPRRLGLPNFRIGRTYLALTITPNTMPPGRIPLIFDSDWDGLLFWWPGGRTLPIGCIAPPNVPLAPADGLEEVVFYGASYVGVNDQVVWLIAE